MHVLSRKEYIKNIMDDENTLNENARGFCCNLHFFALIVIVQSCSSEKRKYILVPCHLTHPYVLYREKPSHKINI